MGVTICLPLFGPPGRELEEGADVKGLQLRKLGADLQERLGKAADMLEKLHDAGWSARVALYDVILSPQGVESKEQAEGRLRELGLSVEDFIIIEDVEEEEETGHA